MPKSPEIITLAHRRAVKAVACPHFSVFAPVSEDILVLVRALAKRAAQEDHAREVARVLHPAIAAERTP